MKIFSILRSIDFLGKSISFTINSKKTFKTILGGILSISIYLGYLFLFIEFGQNYFFKKNPSGYSQIKPSASKEAKAFPLANNPFIMGFQMYDTVGNLINIEEYFHPIFVYREVHIGKYIFFGKKKIKKLIKIKITLS